MANRLDLSEDARKLLRFHFAGRLWLSTGEARRNHCLTSVLCR